MIVQRPKTASKPGNLFHAICAHKTLTHNITEPGQIKQSLVGFLHLTHFHFTTTYKTAALLPRYALKVNYLYLPRIYL